MDIRKKLLSIVGVLALTMSMTAGMVSAQENVPVTTSGSIGLTFTVSCVATSATAVSLTNNVVAGPVAFPPYDPATNTTGTVTTADDAIRVNVTLACPNNNWSLSSTITDFSTDPADGPVTTFTGDHFRMVSTNQWTTDGTNSVPNVDEPGSPVIYSGTDAPYSSPALATATGSTLTNGSMYMDFTGQLVNLTDIIEDGDYSATMTVTYNPGTP